MKVNFNAPILDLTGNPIIESKTSVALYKDRAHAALISGYENELLNYEAKFARVELANRIKAADDTMEVTFAEACLVLELVSRMSIQPLFTWRFGELFEKASAGGQQQDEVNESEAPAPAPPRLSAVENP